MKHRRQSEHDPHYLVRKYDKMGNVRPEWAAVYVKKVKVKRTPPRKPKL